MMDTGKLHINPSAAIRKAAVIAAALLACAVSACRHDEVVIPTEEEAVGERLPDSPVAGFYLLNEGNMGSNKCSLDYYDYSSGMYLRNIYAERNPNVVKELGDVGNDLQLYAGRLWAVVNCSHKVEVCDAATAIRIGQVDIPNCRYIAFNGDKAYVSSYVGPVQINPQAPRGMVYEIDIPTLQITRRVTVGYQPEEIVIESGRLYVANSGGYRAPDYDNTISVVDLETFRQIRQIPVAINLHRLRLDSYGRLWATSRGNRSTVPSRLFTLEKDGEGEYQVTRELPYACSNMAVTYDYIYYFATEWSDLTQSNTVSYGKIDLATCRRTTANFITDGTQSEIEIPYAIGVNPASGDIFVGDAKNYVSSGMLNCYSPEGKRKWRVRTGDIPSSIAFRWKEGGKRE